MQSDFALFCPVSLSKLIHHVFCHFIVIVKFSSINTETRRAAQHQMQLQMQLDFKTSFEIRVSGIHGE
jgi:hypothetical protein